MPTLEELCLISGRDLALWTDESLIADLADSICEQTGAGPGSRVLEVGCAGGFLAAALSPRVAGYTGVDVAPRAVAVARRLRLPNAEFHVVDGARLSFPDQSFDVTLCYDVLTNIPTLDDATPVIREMIRVTRVGGRVLIGSLAYAGLETELVRRAEALRKRRSAMSAEGRLPRGKPAWRKMIDAVRWRLSGTLPQIVTFSYRSEDFLRLASELGVEAEILPIHRRNPYHGCRFNVLLKVSRS